ncbi:MAG: TIGR03000 domain-containing protein [Planctomycetes bacterium]|nr:TIGR03000 domain-containing protein [Planctomycetota bacterium]
MTLRLIKLLAPSILLFASGSASAQHHGGGHGDGGHMGGGHVGGYHTGGYGGGNYHHGGYSGGYRGYSGYGYGGYGGLGYPFLGGYGLGYGGYGYGGYGLGGYGLGGYGLGGYGLGYRGYGTGLGSGGYGYSYPYSSGYSYPYSSGYSYPSTLYNPGVVPLQIGSGVVQASGINSIPSTAATPAPATVTVMVPDGAQVWFNGNETNTTGSSRVFTSPTIQPGQSTTLSVQARWDGSTRSMQVPMEAGDNMTIDLR